VVFDLVVRLLTTDIGDESAARETATDLLEDALVMRAPLEPGGAPTIGYRAEWIGSPLGLGAFGVHRDAEVSPSDLAAVVQGRHAREGGQVYLVDERRPELPDEPLRHANFVLEIPAPETVAQEYPGASSERRAELERVALVSAGAALEHARRTVPIVPVVNGEAETTFVAPGISAAAIVRTPDENGGLRVEVVVLGAEYLDAIVMPDPEAVEALERVAAGEGLEHAARLANLVPEPPAARWVGRGDAWVRDPFEAWEGIVGSDKAASLGSGSTLARDAYLQMDDLKLDNTLTELGEPFAQLDPDLAAASREADDELRRVRQLQMRATEEMLLFAGRGFERDRSLDGAVNTASTEAALEARVQQLEREYEQAGVRADVADHIEAWAMFNWQDATKWIAAARERAIRDREQELARLEIEDPAAREAVRLAAPPPPGERGLGFEERHTWNYLMVGREEVSVPSPLERVSGLVDEAQLQWLDAVARPLSEWVARQPDEWVAQRHAELGKPDEHFDRGGAREVLWIEAHQAPLDKRLAELEGQGFSSVRRASAMETISGDLFDLGGLTEPEIREYRAVAAKRERLDAQMTELQAAGRDPQAWLADRNHIVLAAVYEHEEAIRQEMELQTEVGVAVRSPGKHIVDRVGPRREGEWEEVVHDLEYLRLSSEADASRGVERDHWADRQMLNQLDKRVDRLREETGMEPLAQQGLEGPGPDLGM
jgi:hypothetical protein